ncbi:endonuclease/exonuclease/phosphatase family protein [Gossypium australe]|uniref:Endonuclease/exonuclease/phosphatase family protein n=1 Tax=Gossypium australe TaxID=47621 RepID=A0A5B6USJ4_9ROSI|nr:endonuclease/exonuclease/phosphatase family protein [Gossypium australe]
MICIAWNGRGLGNPRGVLTLRELVHFNKPNRLGRSGEFALFWNSTFNISIFGLTGFHGFPESSRKRGSWAFLRHLASLSSLPWMCFGDFNNLLSINDKKGGAVYLTVWLDGFRDCVSDCNLLEGRGTSSFVMERLNRAFVNDAWVQRYPFHKLYSLVCPISYHSPIKFVVKARFQPQEFGASSLRSLGLVKQMLGLWCRMGLFLPTTLQFDAFSDFDSRGTDSDNNALLSPFTTEEFKPGIV